jgi:hypothetical protein
MKSSGTRRIGAPHEACDPSGYGAAIVASQAEGEDQSERGQGEPRGSAAS